MQLSSGERYADPHPIFGQYPPAAIPAQEIEWLCNVGVRVPLADRMVSFFTSGPKYRTFIMQESIVDTWAVDISNQVVTVKGTVTLRSDGTFISRALFQPKAADASELQYEGTWEVRDSFLIETVTKSVIPKYPAIGTVTRDKVVQIDDKQFTYKTESGKQVTRIRKKKG
jgi:hypothetical protein